MTFEWCYCIGNVIDFAEVEITVYAPTYEESIRKIKSLKLPSLKFYEDIREGLKLTSVCELDEGDYTEPPTEEVPQ